MRAPQVGAHRCSHPIVELAACGALIAREEIGICVGKHQGGCRSPEVVGDVSIAPKEKGVAHSGVAKKCF